MAQTAALVRAHVPIDALADIITNYIADQNGTFSALCEGGHYELCDDHISSMVNNLDKRSAVDQGLCAASRAGHEYIVRLLAWRDGANLLFAMDEACGHGHAGVMCILFEYGPTFDWNWNTHLKDACTYGHVECAQFALDRGATRVDVALHGACRYGHVAAAQLMLNRGASHILAGLNEACVGGHVGTSHLMINSGASVLANHIHSACHRGNVDLLCLYLGHIGHVGRPAWNEWLAVANGNAEIVALLLDAHQP